MINVAVIPDKIIQRDSGKMKMDKNSIWLFSILLLALALRIAALLSLKDSIYYNYLLYDENVYHTWAVKIARADYSSFIIHDFAPLYAWVMGGIYKLISPDFFYVRIFNIILGVITCYIIYLAGRELKDVPTGLVAAFMAGIYKPFIFFNITIHKTTLSVFLFAILVWLFIYLLKKDSLIKVVCAGLCTGLLINVRSNAIVIIPVIIFFILKRGYVQKSSVKQLSLIFLMFCIGNIAALAPFGIINYKMTKEISVMPSGGFNLYIGNNTVNSEPYYRPLPFASSVPSLQATQFIIEASKRAGKKLDAGQASSFWTNKVIMTVSQAPGKFAVKTGRKILALLNRAEVADNHHLGFLSRHIKFFGLPLPGIWLIMPFGLATLIFFFSSSGTIKALGFLFLAYAFTLVIFFTNVRIRLPLITILIPMTAFGISAIYSWIKENRSSQIFRFICVALFFYVLASVPVKSANDITGHLNTHAMALRSHGQVEKALSVWEKSSETEGSYSGYANLTLAKYQAAKGNIAKAHYYLNKIDSASFMAAAKFDFLGDLFRKENSIYKAIEAFKKSLEINYGQRGVWKKLILLVNKTDKKQAHKYYQEYKFVDSFYQD